MVMRGGETESCCSSRASEASPAAAVASRKRRPKVEVYQEVLRRLRESNCEEACKPSFEDELWSHFSRLPVRQLPYANLTPLQAAIGVVQKDLRPVIPKHTPPEIVGLLERCWQQDPSSRPEFSEIISILLHCSKMVVEDKRSIKKKK